MAALIKWALRAVALIGLVLMGNAVIEHVAGWLNVALMPHTEEFLHNSIVIGIGVYVALMALPFVPGAEIGLTLLTVLGGAIAPLVYLATALSLTIAYAVGRFLPPSLLQRGLAALGLGRAADFVQKASQMDYNDFQEKLAPSSSSRILRLLVRHRYIALALALNMPGNVVLGGGGGLALMAGLSRLFAPLSFIVTILIAVLPVPLAFFLGQN